MALTSAFNVPQNSGDVDYQSQIGKGTNLHSDIIEKFRVSRRARAKYEPDWLVGVEFLAGNHYIAFRNGRILFEPIPEDRAKRKPRPVYNYLRTEIETLVAYLTRNSPMFCPAANRGDAKSQAAAILGRQLSKYYFLELEGPEALEDALLWSMVGSMGIWEIGWDPYAGPKLEAPAPMPPAMGGAPEQQPSILQGLMQKLGFQGGGMQPPAQQQPQAMPIGDPYIKSISPFEFFPDPGAQRPKDIEWAVTATMRPTDRLKREFAQFADDITPDVPGEENGYARRTLASWGSETYGTPLDQMNRTLTYELWAKPTQDYPSGLHAVCTQNLVVFAGPTPQGYDAIPFALLRDRTVPGRLWPDATAKDLVPLNKIINRSFGQTIDHASKHKAKWLAPKDSLEEGQINDEDGEIVTFNLGGPAPVRVNPPDVPEAPMKTLDIAKRAMEDSSGANASMQGQQSGETRSGRQVAYNQAAAENRLSLPAQHLARFLSRAGTLLLKQVNANVQEPRIARIVGANRSQQVRMFRGSDLDGGTDVTVEPGSLLGFTRSERFDKFMQLAGANGGPSILKPEQVLEGLELEDFYPLTDEIATDRNNAYGEEEQWRQHDFSAQQPPAPMPGMPPPMPGAPPPPPEPGMPLMGVYYFDDHAIHLNTHNKFRKSPDYRLLPPPERALVDAHCKVHENYVNPPPELMPPPMPPHPGPGGPPPPGGPSPATPHTLPGEPMNHQEQAQSMKQSGSELAAGLPPVPPVSKPGGPATAT